MPNNLKKFLREKWYKIINTKQCKLLLLKYNKALYLFNKKKLYLEKKYPILEKVVKYIIDTIKLLIGTLFSSVIKLYSNIKLDVLKETLFRIIIFFIFYTALLFYLNFIIKLLVYHYDSSEHILIGYLLGAFYIWLGLLFLIKLFKKGINKIKKYDRVSKFISFFYKNRINLENITIIMFYFLLSILIGASLKIQKSTDQIFVINLEYEIRHLFFYRPHIEFNRDLFCKKSVNLIKWVILHIYYIYYISNPPLLQDIDSIFMFKVILKMLLIDIDLIESGKFISKTIGDILVYILS